MEINPFIVYSLLIFNGLLTGLGSFFGQIVGKKVYNNIKKVVKINKK